jgi:HAMP domain-containing protein
MNKRSKANGSAKESISSVLPETLTPSNSTAKKNGLKPKNGKAEEAFALKKYDDEGLDTRELLRVLGEVRNGNFSLRMPIDKIGISGKICDTLNEIISLNEILMLELTKAGKTIGKQGNLTHRVELPKYAAGSWRAGVDSINGLISDLVHPTIEIAHVISSVAKGNLSQEMPLQIGDHVLQGEFSRIAKVEPVFHGSDPCGPRGRLRRKIGWASPC